MSNILMCEYPMLQLVLLSSFILTHYAPKYVGRSEATNLNLQPKHLATMSDQIQLYVDGISFTHGLPDSISGPSFAGGLDEVTIRWSNFQKMQYPCTNVNRV